MLLLTIAFGIIHVVSCNDHNKKQTIVLSLPDNYYYAKHTQDIAVFAKELASKALGYDDVIVLYPSKFVGKNFDLGEARCIIVNQPIDFWMRDFGLVNPVYPVKFRYEPKYLKKVDSKWVDASFRQFLSNHGIDYQKSNVALDGGNVVDNGVDKAIISDRIFKENAESADDVKQRVKEALGMDVAYIPDPQDTTGHSDGIVSFVEKNTVLIADLSDEYYYKKVESAIKNAFPGIKTIRLPCPDAKDARWKNFRSAIGAYANILVTDSSAYMPIFRKGQNDKNALNIVREYSDRRVVTIDTSKLSMMGGSVRCMSWQISSENSIAQILSQSSIRCKDI